MRDEDRIRLKHMIEACEAAVHFVTGRTREDLDRDRMLFFAVVRAVEIIGEAPGVWRATEDDGHGISHRGESVRGNPRRPERS
jgi:uncharacterized protein with HEPN domain